MIFRLMYNKGVVVIIICVILLPLYGKKKAQKRTKKNQKIVRTAPNEEKLVNRHVLVLDFVNEKKAKKADYLSVSIPEAFLTPLEESGSFEVIPREEGTKVIQKNKIPRNQLSRIQVAQKIGNLVKADVVVMGSYIAIQSKIRILAKAIDVRTGRVKVTRQVQGKIDSSIFDKINELANKMVEKMKKELPPLPPREIIRKQEIIKEKVIIKNKNKGFIITANGVYLLPVPSVGNLQQAFGARINVEFPAIFHYLYFYGTSAAVFFRRSSGSSVFMYYGQAGLYYPLWEKKQFKFLPYMGGGLHGGSVPEGSTFLFPSMEAGLTFHYFFYGLFGVNFNIGGSYLFDPGGGLFTPETSLGFSFRW
ncbi:MAG: hypothetical protein D6767_10780 [Candidatus Hydrogenedentota bacterium]|nr:MAG: hypothetical protein D6767_10780 [Candidatus Hydrogenedentota bacterium]